MGKHDKEKFIKMPIPRFSTSEKKEENITRNNIEVKRYLTKRINQNFCYHLSTSIEDNEGEKKTKKKKKHKDKK